MELTNFNSINPRITVINKTNEKLNLEFYYDAIKDDPLKFSNIAAGRQSVKNIPVMRLNGRAKLMMKFNDEIICVYNNLGVNNDLITITVSKNNDKIETFTKVTSAKAKAAEMGSLIGKFYNIVIGLLIAVSIIIYIVQKLSK